MRLRSGTNGCFRNSGTGRAKNFGGPSSRFGFDTFFVFCEQRHDSKAKHWILVAYLHWRQVREVGFSGGLVLEEQRSWGGKDLRFRGIELLEGSGEAAFHGQKERRVGDGQLDSVLVGQVAEDSATGTRTRES